MPVATRLLVVGRHAHTFGAAVEEGADAVLVQGGTIAWVGRSDDAPAADRVLKLDGATLLPGLTDAHVHLVPLAQARLQLPIAAARTIGQVVETVHDAAIGPNPPPWLIGAGLNELDLDERRLPTRDELDAASPSRPVLLRRFCGHIVVANTAALAMAGLHDGAADPDGGEFGRSGDRLDGTARERAAEMINAGVPPPSRSETTRALGEVATECLSLGITAAVEAAVGFTNGFAEEWALWQHARGAGGLPLRLGFMLQADVAGALAAGLAPGPHDPWWQVRTLKTFADGILSGRTAALSRPYEGGSSIGLFMHPEDDLRRVILDAHAAGWEVAVHAVGDRAVGLVTRALAEAQAASPRPDLRHRVEHFTLPSGDDFSRMKRSGAIAVMQPSFIPRMGDLFAPALGPERVARLHPLRSVLAAGIPLAASSDAPTGSLSPWIGMASAMIRRSASGTPIAPNEAVSAREALAGYVTGGAYAMGHEGWRGRLAPGLSADLIALDRDPLAAAPDDLARTVTRFGMIHGRVVFDPDGLGGGSASEVGAASPRPGG